MKVILTATYHFSRWTLRLLVLALALAAVALLVGRALTTRLPAYKDNIAQLLSDAIGAPAHIEAMQVNWRGWTPTLQLEGLRIDPVGGGAQVELRQGWVRLNLLDSLLNRRWVLWHIRLDGVRLVQQSVAAEAGDLPTQWQRLAGWLRHIPSLDVVFAEWRLESDAAAPLIFHDVRLSLRDNRDGRRLDVAARLPAALGEQAQAVVQWRGDSADPAAWNAAFYARGDALQWAGWPLPIKPAAGRVSRLELWGDWRDAALQTLRGKTALEAITAPALPNDGGLRKLLATLPTVGVSFDWRRDGAGWQLASDWQGGDSSGKPLFHSKVNLSWLAAPQDGTAPRLELQGRDLRGQDVAALAAPWLGEPAGRLLLELNPQGALPELLARLPLTAAGSAPRFDLTPGVALAARFQQLSMRPAGNIPGGQGLTGRLLLDADQGQLELASSGLRLEAPWLRGPVEFDALRGPLQWRRTSAGLVLNSAGLTLNQKALALRLQGAATLFTDGASPLLDLKLQLKNIDFGQLRRLTPAPLLHPSLVQWLDRALVSGRVTTGELTLRGRPADFPFDKNPGLFEARLQLNDAILDYDPVWPRLDALNAQLWLRNRVFRVEAATARMFDADIPRLQAKITDITQQPVLEFEGQAKGSGATLLRFLRDTPAGRKAESYLKNMQLSGSVGLDLTMQIPLDPRPNTWQGAVHCDGNTLKLPDWSLELQRLQGKLGFTEHSLTAKELRLALRGAPLVLDINPNPRSGGAQFRLRGQADPRLLGNEVAALLAPYMQGRSRWEATLELDVDRPDELSLELASDLTGVTLALPAPLDKPAAAARPFRLRAQLQRASGAVQARIDYEPAVQATVQILDFPARPHFDRGELRIGGGEARLPAAAGLTVVAQLPRLDLLALQSDNAAPPRWPDWLTAVTLRTDQLLLGGQRFPQVSLQAQRRDNALSVELDGRALAGRISIPAMPRVENPVDIRLRKLALSGGNEPRPKPAVAASYDPRSLPPLRLTVDELTLAGVAVGSLQLTARPQPNGLRFEPLQLRSPLHQLSGNGEWLKTPTGALSRLQVSLKSSDLGKTLQAFGYRAALEGGRTEAELNVAWPAPLPAFSPELLQGGLELRVYNGQLPEVEPGVGRVMGLLNLFNLVRRLRLDFSDLFGQGLSFDRIDGKFRFAGGRADTSLNIQAPSGRIQLDGQVDFTNRTYQQTARVMPQLSAPLAIAGALAGGPVLGAVGYVAGQVLKPGLDHLVRFKFAITGAWENPTITPLHASAGNTAAQDDAADNPPVPLTSLPSPER